MSLLSLRRDLRLAAIVGTAGSLVVVACGGSSSTANTANPDTDGGTSSGGSVASSSGGNQGTGSGSVGSSSGSGGNQGSSSGSVGSSSGGNQGSSSGSVANGDDSGTVSPVDAAACSATASEVVMIGDSYLALSGEITTHLESLATAGGALAAGGQYRHYYRVGANMYPYASSTVTPIPTQFTQAVTASADIKYVIMDGGGNDILLQNPGCIDSGDAATVSDPVCVTAVQNAIDTATTLFQTMKTAGVEKVIYFFYPHLPTTGKPDVNIIMDYAYPLVQTACTNAAIPCSFIDTRPSFEGHPEYIGPDNIHPTTAGSDVIAGLIWGVMQQECVAL